MVGFFDGSDERKRLQKSHELYTTPAECASILFEFIDVRGKSFIEPACNKAPFCAQAKANGSTETWGVDSRRVESAACDHFLEADFLGPISQDSHIGGFFDVAAFNPPFSKAVEFVNRARELVQPKTGVVAFLQKLDLLAGKSREHWWRAIPLRSVVVLPKRYSFTDDGQSDMHNYAYYVVDHSISPSKTKPQVLWANCYESRP